MQGLGGRERRGGKTRGMRWKGGEKFNQREGREGRGEKGKGGMEERRGKSGKGRRGEEARNKKYSQPPSITAMYLSKTIHIH